MEDNIITVNSVSGGKTSSYMAAHFPADYNIFSLITTNDKKCLFPDDKIRKVVSEKIGREFIGTLEEDEIIYTMLDLEQFIGSKINWLVGPTFEDTIGRGTKRYLPNGRKRICTTSMKIDPMKEFWFNEIRKPIETRIGYRSNETTRVTKMLKRCSIDGFIYEKFPVGNTSNGGIKWKEVQYQRPSFPLVNEKPTLKDEIEKFWKRKPVRFAHMNNCVGCFHRNPVLLKYMSQKHPNKFQWFIDQEDNNGYGKRTFINGTTYQKIKDSNLDTSSFSDNDFNNCDTGYCGI